MCSVIPPRFQEPQYYAISLLQNMQLNANPLIGRAAGRGVVVCIMTRCNYTAEVVACRTAPVGYSAAQRHVLVPRAVALVTACTDIAVVLVLVGGQRRLTVSDRVGRTTLGAPVSGLSDYSWFHLIRLSQCSDGLPVATVGTVDPLPDARRAGMSDPILVSIAAALTGKGVATLYDIEAYSRAAPEMKCYNG